MWWCFWPLFFLAFCGCGHNRRRRRCCEEFECFRDPEVEFPPMCRYNARKRDD